jgi:hypothetical protein
MREWRATELMGDYAMLAGGVGYGYVDDLIVSKAGDLEAVVIRPDVTYGRYAPYAYPYYGYSFGWEPGLGYYGLPYTTADIDGLEPFDYEQMDMGDDADEEMAAADAQGQDEQKN